ncbi:response regulator transcription factor [Streptosporangium sp. 'caverna']|uniref:response regulator n=1 Tax=Streptosporangium sp. 'caverna' TaxID=2202249 RepID=UPI000D7DC502|nr:response regulator transcription factor [Streptosporangium sp. 'caverna']AWS40871.1 DNA-binding response regulator [Streptosporangium sp. 'caverna']
MTSPDRHRSPSGPTSPGDHAGLPGTAPADDRTSVLIADDQPVVLRGFAAVLRAQPDLTVVGTAPDGAQAVRLARETRPDVALLDIRMPVMDGIEAARRILETETTRVIMITTFDLDDYVYDALTAGASGFLLKDVPANDLAEAVRTVARGDALLAPRITRRLIAEFSRQRRPPPAGSPLTPRETEVLRLIARGLSNAEIAAGLVVTEHTVKTHVARLLAKLGLRDRTQAVIHAYESGLVIPRD